MSIKKQKSVYFSAPVNGLIEGLYREKTTIGEIREKGDFGIGTFNRLDGEMVMLRGDVFRIRADGKAYPVEDSEQTPFACVTYFKPDTVDEFPGLTGEDLFSLVARSIPSDNMLYAIHVEGTFRYIKTRSVPPQEDYRPLVEVAREQPEFEYENMKGTMVGFHTPDFLKGIGVPGIHLHFLSADHSCGGHLLASTPAHVTIGIQHIPELTMSLPMTLDFLTTDFKRDTAKDLEEAEK